MEINVDNYLSEQEKKQIVIDVFKENIERAFGGEEYSNSSKERERIINNSVAKWIQEYIEKTLTEDDKAKIADNVRKSIDKDLSFYVFSKPDVWDRTEYSAHKIIQQTVKDNEDFIKSKVKESIYSKFNFSNES